MLQPIDLAFLVAKAATLKEEKAKILVDVASLAYNVAMVNRLANIQKDYISICGTIDQVARLRGYCTQEEYNLAQECQHHVAECEVELRKYKNKKTITKVIDSQTVSDTSFKDKPLLLVFWATWRSGSQSGLYRASRLMRESENENEGFCMAMKGGHNGESHNHSAKHNNWGTQEQTQY